MSAFCLRILAGMLFKGDNLFVYIHSQSMLLFVSLPFFLVLLSKFLFHE